MVLLKERVIHHISVDGALLELLQEPLAIYILDHLVEDYETASEVAAHVQDDPLHPRLFDG